MAEWFHRVAILEGISYLVLLLVAMPLKYLAGYEMAVQVVGWAHGALFIAYMVILGLCWIRLGWSRRFVLIAFIASLLPAGPFFLHPPREENPVGMD
ncbi:DUF3817 domain-containing protein [Puniceicoccus vermicola]|uniref:DUF3817 domain-containing protein n=1 Tax=Puniceicoccus vermicola TaxID=388746 RepID=A0A7X1AVV8_9BACT|nr:DUF3817 domain-containing protein [Puniceicoccus vermicola]MBC2600897.1 DUF3817 domain-containing protein [Puniceicoccus vermicola]